MIATSDAAPESLIPKAILSTRKAFPRFGFNFNHRLQSTKCQADHDSSPAQHARSAGGRSCDATGGGLRAATAPTRLSYVKSVRIVSRVAPRRGASRPCKAGLSLWKASSANRTRTSTKTMITTTVMTTATMTTMTSSVHWILTTADPKFRSTSGIPTTKLKTSRLALAYRPHRFRTCRFPSRSRPHFRLPLRGPMPHQHP